MFQNRKRTNWVGLGILLVVVLKWGGLAGCGGGSGGNGNPNVNVGTGTGNVVADTSTAISEAMNSAFQGVNAGIANSSQTIQCNPGQAVISGSASGGNPVHFSLTSDLNDCAGLDGSIQMSGEVSSGSSNDFTANFTVSGTIGGHGCAVDFNSFGADITGSNGTATFLLSGSVDSTCGSATVTCDYNGVNSQDPVALQAACTCSGTGC